MKIDSYMETLMSDNEDSMKDFIKKNGKPRKPVCPIYFTNITETSIEKEETNNDREQTKTNEK